MIQISQGNLKLQGKVWRNYDISIGYSCTGKDPNSKSFWGFSPDPTWRAYSGPWIPPAVLRPELLAPPLFRNPVSAPAYIARDWTFPAQIKSLCFNFGKIDGGIFDDESFMMKVPAGSPLKTDNAIKWMDRTSFIFSSKINLFITYTDYFLQKRLVNSMATDVVFRESLLKLKMYL